MEGRRFLRFFSIPLSIGLVLLFTWSHLPYAPPYVSDLLDYTTNSAWCSSKNHIQSKPPISWRCLKDHSSDTPHHHLDPLTIQELNAVRTVLNSHAFFTSTSSYTLHSAELQEPDKSLLLGWKHGDPFFPRKASIIACVYSKSLVLTVDLTTSEVTVHEIGSYYSYPTMMLDELTTAMFNPLKNADFNRTIVEHGVDLGRI